MASIDYERIANIIEDKIAVHTRILKEELRSKEVKIAELEKRVSLLESKLEDQEQYSRRTSIRINGIKEEQGEDVRKKLADIFQGINIQPMIQRCHRVGPKVRSLSNSPVPPTRSTSVNNESLDKSSSGSPPASAADPSLSSQNSTAAEVPPALSRPIICQFTGYYDRQVVLSKRREILSLFPLVFVNEDLTRARAKLLYKARQLKKRKLVLDAWSVDGRIVVKDKSGKMHYIRSEDDLKW